MLTCVGSGSPGRAPVVGNGLFTTAGEGGMDGMLLMVNGQLVVLVRERDIQVLGSCPPFLSLGTITISIIIVCVCLHVCVCESRYCVLEPWSTQLYRWTNLPTRRSHLRQTFSVSEVEITHSLTATPPSPLWPAIRRPVDRNFPFGFEEQLKRKVREPDLTTSS